MKLFKVDGLAKSPSTPPMDGWPKTSRFITACFCEKKQNHTFGFSSEQKVRRTFCVIIKVVLICMVWIVFVTGCTKESKPKDGGVASGAEEIPLSTEPRFKLTRYRLPSDSSSSNSVDAADFDLDGDLDILVGNYNGNIRLYQNNGAAFFNDITDSILSGTVMPARDVRFVDVDLDGDPDIVVANDQSENLVYINDHGFFRNISLSSPPAPPKPARQVLTGDIDEDGYYDLVFINYNLKNTLYHNNGDNSFTDMSYLLPDIRCPFTGAVLADIDGDGDPDIITAGRCDDGGVFINDGKAGFTADNKLLPFFPDDSISPGASDIDNDGDIDIIIATRGLLYVYRNNTGQFGPPEIMELSSPISGISIGDIDNDKYEDIVMAGFDGGNRLYLNDGGGGFRDMTSGFLPFDRDNTKKILLSDLDGDGRLDMLVANDGQNRLYLNNGNGFDDLTSIDELPADSDSSFMGKLADMNNDGTLDLVVANFGQDRLYQGDGAGGFTDVTVSHLPDDNGNRTYAVDIGDLDGDGDIDMVFANDEVRNRLYLNDGNGKFSDATYNLPEDHDPSHDIDLADIDGDGDPDIILSNMGKQNRVLINNGSGRFVDETVVRFPVDNDISYHAATGDIDGDGDIDIIFANVGTKLSLYVNNGSGFFENQSSRLPELVGDTDAVALGDLNGDGSLDIFAGNFPFGGGETVNWVYLNNGDGFFVDVTSSNFPGPSDMSCNVVIADVDNDGDLDLMASNQGQDRLYLNDGKAFFTDVTDAYIPLEEDTTRGIVPGDIDRDGDIDLVTLNDFDRQNHLYLNLLNQ